MISDRHWGWIRVIGAAASASLVVGVAVTEITGSTRTALAACLLGLLPVVFFLGAGQFARGVSSTVALVALAAYTAAWIYVVRRYNADKYEGLPLDFIFVPALGGAALATPLAAHWLSYIWRDRRYGEEQSN